MVMMQPRLKVVAIVCIAIFAFAAIAAVPMLALLDAQTPVDGLFSAIFSSPAPAVDDVALRAAPVVDVRSPRAPPLV